MGKSKLEHAIEALKAIRDGDYECYSSCFSYCDAEKVKSESKSGWSCKVQQDIARHALEILHHEKSALEQEGE